MSFGQVLRWMVITTLRKKLLEYQPKQSWRGNVFRWHCSNSKSFFSLQQWSCLLRAVMENLDWWRSLWMYVTWLRDDLDTYQGHVDFYVACLGKKEKRFTASVNRGRNKSQIVIDTSQLVSLWTQIVFDTLSKLPLTVSTTQMRLKLETLINKNNKSRH